MIDAQQRRDCLEVALTTQDWCAFADVVKEYPGELTLIADATPIWQRLPPEVQREWLLISLILLYHRSQMGSSWQDPVATT